MIEYLRRACLVPRRAVQHRPDFAVVALEIAERSVADFVEQREEIAVLVHIAPESRARWFHLRRRGHWVDADRARPGGC